LPQTTHCCVGTNAQGNFVEGPATPNGLFASDDANGAITFIDLISHRQVPDSLDYGSGGTSRFAGTVNMSPNGQLLAISGDSLNLAANPSGRKLATGLAYSGTAQFLDDGHIVEADFVGGQQVLTLEVPQLAKMACAIAGRNLTKQEFKDYVGNEPYHKTCPQWPAGA
jgi:hypothetical protein